MTKCANWGNCGHMVDNPNLKGEFCSLSCQNRITATRRVEAMSSARVSGPVNPQRVEKPATSAVVEKSTKEKE